MSVGIVNTIRKHKKIAGLALPVLVALGAIWPAHKSSAENIFQSIQANIVVSGDLVVSPSASNITLPSNLFTVEWVGIPEGGGNPVRVQVGVDRVRAGGPNTLAQRIASVRIGLIDASQDIKSVNCPPTYGCDFPVETSSLNNNPVDAGAFGSFAPADLEQNRTGTKTYKIVPVYSTALPHLLDGGNASTFTITWDPNVAAAQAQNRSAPTNVTTGAGTLGTIPDVCPPGYRIQLTGGVYGGGNPTCVEDKSLIGALELVTNIILTVILGVVRAVLHFLFGIVLIPILEALLSPSGNFMAAQIPSVVQEMWIYVRDIMNLLFILVLIFAGIATMLRLEGYGLRRTITRVIIIALVVNFSLLIGQIVLNFAQIVMNEFIGPGTLEQVRSGVDIFGDTGRMREFWTINAAEGTRNTAMLLFAIVYEIGMFFVLAAFGALLLIRLVGVWLLLVIAPIAYVLYITEFGKKFFGQWWHRFLSYAFFAPIVAFFIALAAKFVASPTFMSLPPPQGASASQGIGSAIVAAMQGVMVLAILVFGLNIARKMGIAGADMVVGQAQKLWKGAAKGSMTFVPRAIGGTAKAGGTALGRLGTKLASKGGAWGAAGTGLKGLGKGVRGAGSVFKQFGTAPLTAKKLYKSMAETAKQRMEKDAQLTSGTVETFLAKTPALGAMARGLGAKDDAKEIAIKLQVGDELKDLESKGIKIGEARENLAQAVSEGNEIKKRAYMSYLLSKGATDFGPAFEDKQKGVTGLQGFVREAVKRNMDISKSLENMKIESLNVLLNDPVISGEKGEQKKIMKEMLRRGYVPENARFEVKDRAGNVIDQRTGQQGFLEHAREEYNLDISTALPNLSLDVLQKFLQAAKQRPNEQQDRTAIRDTLRAIISKGVLPSYPGSTPEAVIKEAKSYGVDVTPVLNTRPDLTIYMAEDPTKPEQTHPLIVEQIGKLRLEQLLKIDQQAMNTPQKDIIEKSIAAKVVDEIGRITDQNMRKKRIDSLRSVLQPETNQVHKQIDETLNNLY